MKNFLPIIMLVLLGSSIKAQITVNSIDLNVGDVVLQAVDTVFQTNLLNPGENLSWDFSGVHGQRTDTIAPIDPATTNHASSFPDANLAMGTVDFATYLVNNSNNLVALGFGGYIANLGQDVEMVLDDPDTSIVFPINYNDSRYSDAWGQTFASYQGQDFRMSASTQRTQNCDAWGTVTTPHGTYDVLRVQELEISIDSVFAIVFGSEYYQSNYSTFDTTYRYTYYTNDATIKYPLLEVKYDHNVDTILETKWITFMPDNTNRLESTNNSVSVYPNPSSDFITIDTQDALIDSKIYNLSGELVKTSRNNRIDISNLTPSIYFIEVQTKKGIHKEKLVIK